MNFISRNLSLICCGIMAILCLNTACNNTEPLPILGRKTVNDSGDTIYHTIPKFSFINQDSQYVTNQTYAGKIYIADFFFTSCPTICPKMAAQLLRVYKKYRNDDRVFILSHTVDPKRDSVSVLKAYADKLGVSADKWSFVTGLRSELYNIADDYFSIAVEDTGAPGGYNHSGRFLLVDWDGRIRAYCDGTDPVEVSKLMDKIDRLLVEYDKTFPKQ